MGKEKYDLICSLGGNCAAAHNLRYRNLRDASYPFDWTYFNSDEAVYILADSFKNGFENYMLKENLKELPVNPSHPDKIQYEDCFGKIVWANHFSYGKDREKNYSEVKLKYDKRFKRLVNSVKKSDKILFIFCSAFEVNQDSFSYLLNTLHNIYPKKHFDIKVIAFNCQEDKILKINNLEIYYNTRDLNEYDFGKTNFEWRFLDSIKIRRQFFKTPCLQIIPIKKGVCINILPAVFRIINIKMYIFGFRLSIAIGENKDF